ncbi:MAG: PD40 domain-containing protein [Phycisphaerae bacterium]|nr:PD40 domain-containing protein [Phycisphaerae bacterium]
MKHPLARASVPLLLGVLGSCGPSALTPMSDSRARPSPADWAAAEAPYLTGHVQLTTRDRFLKAGEQYFSPDSNWIIFQAVPVPKPGEKPDPFYSMYVARLNRDAGGRVTGLQEPVRISAPGSANTCGWFHPTQPGVVLFGSTLVPPTADRPPGYSRDRSRYEWEFPPETEVCVARLGADGRPMSPAAPIFSRPGYDAEASWSKDGRFILYTHVDPSDNDPNLWIYDSKSGAHTPLITAKGYDGGPFFSPDGKRICYRSDRRGDNLLQLYVADLAFDDTSDPTRPTGIKAEHQITDNSDVNWCPFWHPSAKYLLYATSEIGHSNYEIFAVEADATGAPETLRKARVTFASGFDGLPSFNADGTMLIWCSQRGPRIEGEERPSSQIWLANLAGGTTPWDRAAAAGAATDAGSR